MAYLIYSTPKCKFSGRIMEFCNENDIPYIEILTDKPEFLEKINRLVYSKDKYITKSPVICTYDNILIGTHVQFINYYYRSFIKD